MARVTVEDCIQKVTNRFELVALAAYRAKGINSGLPITIDRDNDKDPVVALREIAGDNIKISDLKEALVKSMQTRKKADPIDDDNLHTELDGTGAEFDYLPDSADLYVNDDHSDLGDDQLFNDDIADDLEDKGF